MSSMAAIVTVTTWSDADVSMLEGALTNDTDGAVESPSPSWSMVPMSWVELLLALSDAVTLMTQVPGWE